MPFSFPMQHFAIWEKDTLNNGDIKEAHKEMSSVKSSKAFKVEMTIWMAGFVKNPWSMVIIAGML